LPFVVPTAIQAARKLEIQARFSAIGGDFFTDVLPPANLYLLRLILNDWNDHACIEILRNCRRSINPSGRLIVSEMVRENPQRRIPNHFLT
jgi:hypothetical protein